MAVCWRTATRASSKRRAWSSSVAGEAMAAVGRACGGAQFEKGRELGMGRGGCRGGGVRSGPGGKASPGRRETDCPGWPGCNSVSAGSLARSCSRWREDGRIDSKLGVVWTQGPLAQRLRNASGARCDDAAGLHVIPLCCLLGILEMRCAALGLPVSFLAARFIISNPR